MFIIAGLTYLLVAMGNHLQDLKKKDSFDPYEILGISTSASEKEVKVAYRKLATIMHPDKHTDDPEAAGKFIKLTQAYNALTDPVAKDNYLKYGSPDGPKSFSIGIPLPSFLFKEEYRTVTLIMFFLFLLVIIPGGGWWIYSTVFKYNKHGILTVNEAKFEELVDEELKAKEVPEVLSEAAEYQERIQPEEPKELEKLLPKEEGVSAKSRKVQLLISAFMNKVPISNSKLLDEQRYVLMLAPRMLAYLADMTAQPGFESPVILQILEFSQHFYQGLNDEESPFLQLPYMTKDTIAQLRLQKKPFKEFLSLTPEKRGLSPTFNETQIQAIESTIATLPKVTLKVSCGVEGSEGIYVGDILSIKIQLDISRSVNDTDSESTEDAPFSAHSNYYPHSKQEIIWLVVSNNKNPSQYNCVKINRKATSVNKKVSSFISKVYIFAFSNVAQQPGYFSYTVRAIFDCYKGLDCTETISIVAKRADQRPVEEEIEDPDLTKPSFVESLVTSIKGKDQDPDAELLEETDDQAKVIEKPKKNKHKKGKKGKVKDDQQILINEYEANYCNCIHSIDQIQTNRRIKIIKLMGNAQSKKRAVFISAGVITLAGLGYGAYRLMVPKSFKARLDREISAIGKFDPTKTRTIPPKTLLKIIIIVFKFSYECRREEKVLRRRERTKMLNSQNYENYVREALEAYRLDHDCEKEILKTVLDKLGISERVYLESLQKERAELQQRHCSVAVLDALGIKVNLTEEQAKRLKSRKDLLTQNVNVKNFLKDGMEAEGLQKAGERWKEVLKMIIVLDKLYMEYGLDEKEIAASLRKYGLGLTQNSIGQEHTIVIAIIIPDLLSAFFKLCN
eukprot:TRINITY_DN88126_c2_g1_i1.p1 TRINITY_DN88126_c2_g1~~TRINITY_DN88126_c2_g1_i1.p1  ORF type:complete len:847 (-),score=111.14 TRINITY_DN88126_c2_g1_i1:1552-4092(-)